MERAALAFAADETEAAARIAAWERWMEHDPNDTDEARAEARIRELMEAV